MLNPHWGRAATGKKHLVPMRAGSFRSFPDFVTLWTVACQAFLSWGFSRQEYWSILANTGCLTPLEHCISCCPGHQLPWVPGAARTPATQAAIPLPYLAFTGADPSPPGQPQEQTPEVEIKPQLKLRGSVVKEEEPEPSHQLYKLLIKLTQSAGQPLCLWKGHWELPQKKTH